MIKTYSIASEETLGEKNILFVYNIPYNSQKGSGKKATKKICDLILEIKHVGVDQTLQPFLKIKHTDTMEN